MYHIVDLVGNHLISSIFTLFLAYILCDLFHHINYDPMIPQSAPRLPPGRGGPKLWK